LKVEEPSLKSSEYECKCGGQKIIGNQRFPVCTSCGLIDSYYLDDSPEWVGGVSEDGVVSDPSRCGMPTDTDLYSASWGRGTMIQTGYRASYAHQRMARINFHNSMNHKDRALFHAYKDMDVAGKDILGLQEAVMRAAKIMYRKFTEEVLTRGAVRVGIKANCVLYACKMNNVNRTTKEIADAFGIPTKDLSRTSDIFKETILGKASIATPESATSNITKPYHIVQRMINEFDIPDRRKIRIKCMNFAKHLEPCVPLMGKTPNSISAVILMRVIGEGTSKQEVVSKCNISMPTLNKIDAIVTKYLEANPFM
jgi:transcription initiation factor TFIIIB Brf1 subunit/transcription initiation factor TFIIB